MPGCVGASDAPRGESSTARPRKVECDPVSDRVALGGGAVYSHACPSPDVYWAESDQVWLYDHEADNWGRLCCLLVVLLPRKVHDMGSDTESGVLVMFGGDEVGPPDSVCDRGCAIGFEDETRTFIVHPSRTG